MAEINNVIAEASQDLQTIEDFVNLPAGSDVYPRLLPSVNVGTLAGTRQAIFEAGGLPATPFETKASMEASGLGDSTYAVVTDDGEYSGLYYKSNGSWVKSRLLSDVLSLSDVRKAIKVSDIGKIEQVDNLLDMNRLTHGVINDDGTENLGFQIYYFSDLIAVDRGNTYTLVNGDVGLYAGEGFYSMAYYDKSLNFIKRVHINTLERPDEITLADDGVVHFVAPNDVAYIRVNLRKNGDMYIHHGSEPMPYSEHGYTLGSSVKLHGNEESRLLSLAHEEVESDLLDVSNNMIDPHSFTPKLSIVSNSPDGVPTPSGSYALSDYIKVSPNTAYNIRSKNFIQINCAVFDVNKNFVANIASIYDVFITPSNTYFARFSVNENAYKVVNNELMLTKGVEPKPYEPYFKEIKPELVPSSVVKDVMGEYIQPKANLFDYNTNTDGVVIKTTGSLDPSPNYSTSDFIKVDPATPYAYSFLRGDGNAFAYTATYDKDRVFIERLTTIGGSNGEPAVFTFDDGVEYIRVSNNFGLPNSYDRMINNGVERAVYRKGFDTTLENVVLGEMPAQSLFDELDYKYNRKILVDSSASGTFHNNRDDDYFSQYSDWKSLSAYDVIDKYEQLRLSNPEYITREELGEDLDGDKIYLYKFTPEKITHSNHKFMGKRPKVFLNLGIHGYERLSTLTTLLTMQNITHNWVDDPLLEVLRFNVEFLVIPISNMYGYKNNGRHNKNGVDINRNFPIPWAEAANGEGTNGTYALSELEAQYIANVLENNDLDVVVDCHTFTGIKDSFIWMTAGSSPWGELTKRVGNTLIPRMSHKFAKDLDFLGKDNIAMLGYLSDGNIPVVRNYAGYLGVPISMTFEISREWTEYSDVAPSYGATHIRTTYETFVNMLLICIDTLQDKY